MERTDRTRGAHGSDATVPWYRRPPTRWFSRAAWGEILLVGTSLALYGVICSTAPADRSDAVRHAWEVISFEHRAGFAVEPVLNTWLVAHPLLALLANYFYTTVFAVTTLGTLVLLWWRDRRVYSFHRSVLFIMTAGAALTYWLYPLAPPRLVPGAGFVDTVSVFGTWGGAYTSTTAEVANVYGAMPSMHTGWSLWVAVCLCAISTKWWQRVLAVSLPVVTILVIMATGNHYALDAMAGALYLGVALLVWMLVLAVRRALGHVDLPTIAPGGRPVRY